MFSRTALAILHKLLIWLYAYIGIFEHRYGYSLPTPLSFPAFWLSETHELAILWKCI